MTLYVSDCCGCEMDPILADYGICPDCQEHCEAELQEWPQEC